MAAQNKFLAQDHKNPSALGGRGWSKKNRGGTPHCFRASLRRGTPNLLTALLGRASDLLQQKASVVTNAIMRDLGSKLSRKPMHHSRSAHEFAEVCMGVGYNDGNRIDQVVRELNGRMSTMLAARWLRLLLRRPFCFTVEHGNDSHF
jgi:hypothetical protein